MIKKIYGVNIAVNDLAEATKTYERFFGVKSIPIESSFFAFPGLEGAELDIAGFRINLIASKEAGTSVANFLEKRGEGLFLLSVEVDSMEADSEAFKKDGFRFLIDEPVNGPFGAVNFIHPKSMHGVQIEVYEPSEEMLARGKKSVRRE